MPPDKVPVVWINLVPLLLLVIFIALYDLAPIILVTFFSELLGSENKPLQGD
jgi:hypothetical protein